MPEQSPTFFIGIQQNTCNSVKFTISRIQAKSARQMKNQENTHNSKEKYPSIEKTGITDLVKLADKVVKTVFINMFHMLKRKT